MFTGRDEILQQINQSPHNSSADQGDTSHLVTLRGTGGVGADYSYHKIESSADYLPVKLEPSADCYSKSLGMAAKWQGTTVIVHIERAVLRPLVCTTMLLSYSSSITASASSSVF